MYTAYLQVRDISTLVRKTAEIVCHENKLEINTKYKLLLSSCAKQRHFRSSIYYHLLLSHLTCGRNCLMLVVYHVYSHRTVQLLSAPGSEN